MQENWQRKRINLNAGQTPPSASSPRTPPPPQPEDPPRSEPVTTVPANSEEVLPTASSNNKRKPRSTRGEEGSKRSRVTAGGIFKEYAPPTVRLADLGGMDQCVEKVLELVAMPLAHPEVYLHTGVQPPRGVLLHGPSGCGKTLLANAIGGVRTSQTDFFFFWLKGASGIGLAVHFDFGPVDRVGHVRRVGKDAP